MMKEYTNCKKELTRKIQAKNRVVKCAELRFDDYNKIFKKTCRLPVNYTEKQHEYFLQSLDFAYNAKHGPQCLFGTVWFTDGTWLERFECNGGEWWVHRVCPEIPGFLLQTELKED